jgi:outer membrane lipoprotein carrier protein
MKVLKIMVLLMLTTTGVLAEKTPIQQLKHFLQQTKTLQANFKQVSMDQQGNPAQISHGVFYLARPGKFRWNYLEPFVQEIVAKENKVWFYDADLEQVTIKTLDESLGATPALLLSGEVDLEQNFTLQQQGVDEDLVWIKLTPKSEDSSFKLILIGMSNGQLAGMELQDNFGQLTRIYFSNLTTNRPLPESIFDFTIPEGADVFGQ